MITMFQVDHREDLPPQLLLQHVPNEGQRIAVMLYLGIQTAVLNNKPPFPGHLLGNDEAGGMSGLQPASVDELPENHLHGLFPRAPEGGFPLPVHTVVWLQSYLRLTVRSTNQQRDHRLCTEEGI